MMMTKKLAILALVCQASAFTVVTQPRGSFCKLNALPFDPTGSAEIAGLLQTGIALPLDLDGVANNAGIAQDQIAVYAAAGAAAIAGLAGIFGSSSTKKDVPAVTPFAAKPKPADVSIPYEATSLLAYAEWMGEKSGLDDELYEKFKVIYKSKTIAAVSLKKVQRDTADILCKAEKDTADILSKAEKDLAALKN